MFTRALRTSALTRGFSTSKLAAHHGVVPRQPAPAFTAPAVVGSDFQTISLSDYSGKWLCLFSYPLDFTFACPTEIISFSDRIKEFDAVGASVAAFSVDSKFSHLAWTKLPRKAGGLGPVAYPLIADINKAISKAYGALIEDPADGDAGVTLRNTYIIDPKGIVRAVMMNDLPVGRSVDEVLRLIHAFQYSDKHGEVCPEGWKKGKPTMIGDPVKSLKYFEQVNK